MPLPFWLALAFLLVSTTFAAFHVFRNVREVSRTFKIFGPALEGTTDELNRSLETLSRNSEEMGSSMPRLETSLARLRTSVARASILAAAVQDARDSLRRLVAVYPRK